MTQDTPRSFLGLDNRVARKDSEGQIITYGDWQTEEESAAALDQVLDSIGLFKVYSEVQGTCIQPRPNQAGSRLRIDRVLTPKQSLVDRGWAHGMIGIEIKASQMKAAPAVSQMLDYSRAIWKVNPGGFQVMLSWVFLWPLGEPKEAIASIMGQNCVGSAWQTDRDALCLYSGSEKIIRIKRDGSIELGKALNGRRNGTRSLERQTL